MSLNLPPVFYLVAVLLAVAVITGNDIFALVALGLAALGFLIDISGES